MPGWDCSPVRADLPLGEPISETMDPRVWTLISYAKPAHFYDRLRQEIGDEAFFAAVRQYLATHRFQVRADRGPVEVLLARSEVQPADLGALAPLDA